MLRTWRWAVVLVGVVALAVLPSIVGSLPVARGESSAATLLTRILRSGKTPHSGYAESSGGLALPVSGQLNSLTELLGGHTQQRVWWRGAQDYRIDTVTTTGETDVHASPRGNLTWDYESGRVTFSDIDQARVRLPVAADLLPSELGRRLLGGALASEVTTLPSRRVAGRAASGLRLRPASATASIDHVDIWADDASAIPLYVTVFAKGDPLPAMFSTFLDFSATMPPASDTAFDLPPTARITPAPRFDLVRFIDLLSGVPLPDHLGSDRRTDTALGTGSIGIYGRGITQYAVLQLPDRTNDSLREQLPAAKLVGPDERVTMTVGPLSLVITAPDDADRSWLLVGTVTVGGLGKAADELAAQQLARRSRR